MTGTMFDNRCCAWLLGKSGLAVALSWGFAEGTLFFMVPDIILTLTALFSLKRSFQQMGLVVVGSLFAGGLMFQWAQTDPAAVRSVVRRVPFVRERMFTKTAQDFQTLGVNALFVGPTQGIPYKVYAVEAPAHCSLALFLLASIPARLERLVLSWIVFAGIGLALRRWQVRARFALLFHGGYWAIVYAYYWTVI